MNNLIEHPYIQFHAILAACKIPKGSLSRLVLVPWRMMNDKAFAMHLYEILQKAEILKREPTIHNAYRLAKIRGVASGRVNYVFTRNVTMDAIKNRVITGADTTDLDSLIEALEKILK